MKRPLILLCILALCFCSCDKENSRFEATYRLDASVAFPKNVSDFLADIGNRTGTAYSCIESPVIISNMRYGFTNFGIGFTEANAYSWNIVMNSLVNSDLPVYYTAMNAHGKGHSFVIDGWSAAKDVITYTYHWALVRDGELVEIDHDTYYGYIEGHQLNPLEQEYTYEIYYNPNTIDYSYVTGERGTVRMICGS